MPDRPTLRIRYRTPGPRRGAAFTSHVLARAWVAGATPGAAPLACRVAATPAGMWRASAAYPGGAVRTAQFTTRAEAAAWRDGAEGR